MYRRRNRRREEQRQRILAMLFKLSLVLGVFGLVTYYAYEVGVRVAERDEGNLKDQLQKAMDEVKAGQEKQDVLQGELAESRQQADSLKALYEQVKPTDEMKDLEAALRAKLGEGMEARRLALLIKSARKPHDCTNLAVKRFLVRTPLYKGPAATTSVRIDDALTISAEGAGANGGHEQWFDAERPVKVSVIAGGAKEAELAGPLPLEHAVAVKNSEYHFTVSAAPSRGWVEVNTERCDFR